MRRWTSDLSSNTGPMRRNFWRDERAVSEAIGYTLTFGILAGILVLAMYGFNQNQQETEEAVANLQAQSMGQRTVSAIIRAGVLVEERELDTYRHLIEADETMDGNSYTVRLTATTVNVTVPAFGLTAAEPLFATGQSITVCPTTVDGGFFYVAYGTPPAGSGCADPSMFLEEA